MKVTPSPNVQPTQSGLVVHVGAGSEDRTAEFLEWNPARILLVEPDPVAFVRLRADADTDPSVRVVQAGIARDSGRAVLQRYNLPGIANLRGSLPNSELYPGLKSTAQIDVDVLSPGDLLAEYDLVEGEGNRLVVDTPGDEADVTQAFAEPGILSNFDYFDVRCYTASLFDSPGTCHLILSYASSNGFKLQRVRSLDTEFPYWSFTRNSAALESERLRARLEASEGAFSEISQRLDEENQRATEQGRKIADLEAALANMKSRATEEEEQCRNRENRIAELEHELKLAHLRLRELEQEILGAEEQISIIHELLDMPAGDE